MSLPLYWKLLLVAAMTGNDICVSFQQLYQVPLVQILGVPATFVSFYPIWAGPIAMILLNLSGFLSDKGTTHRTRKTVVIVLASFITMLGIALLITANIILLSKNQCATKRDMSLSPENLSADAAGTEYADRNSHFGFINMSLQNSADASNSFLAMYISNMTTEKNQSTACEDAFKSENLFSLPVTAYLGLLGFSLMDIGYDVNLGAIRACVLASSPKTDHTSILILALAMAALGGCITNCLGLVDLSQVFDLGAGGSVVAQTTAQLAACGLVLVVCVGSTVTTALLTIRNFDTDTNRSLTDNGMVTEQTRHYGTFDREEGNGGTKDRHNRDLCNKETSFGGKDENTSPSDHSFKDADMNETNSSTSVKDPASQSAERSKKDDDMTDRSASDYISSSVSSLLLSSKIYQNARRKPDLQGWKYGRWRNHKTNFILACITLYLGSSVLYSYNLYTADFLGKVVMGGDSSAPQDSAEFKLYEYGVHLGAGGLLTFYCCYFVISTTHSKLLDVWGLKIDFCVSHALMSAAILSLILSKHVAAFYVCCVMYGFQRSALFSVSFIIANTYLQEKVGESATGKMMAIVTCMVPLNYCTAFLISGPLITLTQYDGTPLLMASVFAGLAALLFFLLYKS